MYDLHVLYILWGIILLGAGSWETEPLKGINEDDGTAKLGSLECMVHEKLAVPSHLCCYICHCTQGKLD